MGTNYYAQLEEVCKCCGRGDEDLHIGKQSAGWQFIFADYPERGLDTAEAWFSFLEGRSILNEYNKPIAPDEFIQMVKHNQGKRHSSSFNRLDPKGYTFSDPGFS